MKQWFRNASLIDGTGSGVQSNVSIEVENGLVKSIVRQQDNPSDVDSENIDLQGKKGVKILDPFSREDRIKIQKEALKIWLEECERLGPEAVAHYKMVTSIITIAD